MRGSKKRMMRQQFLATKEAKEYLEAIDLAYEQVPHLTKGLVQKAKAAQAKLADLLTGAAVVSLKPKDEP